MRKVLFCVVVTAIVALAVINLNLVFKSDSNVSVTLASILSIAQNEDGGGAACYKQSSSSYGGGCIRMFEYYCDPGNQSYVCPSGWSAYECDGTHTSHIDILYCR